MSTPFGLTEEEQGWFDTGKTLDEGRGVAWNFVQREEDMEEAMAALNVSGFAAKSRFRSFLNRMQEPTLPTLMPSLALRKVPCRLWVGEDSRAVYNLNASSFRDLDKAVRSVYKLDDEEVVSLYYIMDKGSVESRRYIANDEDLNIYFNLAGDPIIFVWLRGESNLSPGSLPSEIEIRVASITSSQSSVSDRTRGYVQTLFRNGVRERDGFACVLSGKKLQPKANNVQAAHIIGVEAGLLDSRRQAGVVNPYDTWNGMLLSTSLHSSFDSYLWCMDEFCVVHVSQKGKEEGLGDWEGKRVNLDVGQPLYPSRELLRARFKLYQEKHMQPKQARRARVRKTAVQTI